MVAGDFERVIRVSLTVGVALLALIAFVRWLEPRFAFFPLAGETTTPADFGVDFSPATVATGDGERLRAWLLHADSPRGLVVYFHGNGGNLSVWAPILSAVAHRGYELLAFDYRGYGLSSGRPTETGLYRDAEAIVEHIRNRSEHRGPIIYWGRSLGTAVAAYAATVHVPDGIILESGFSDAWSLVRSVPPLAFLALFSTYRFPTASFLERTHMPALVIHGDADSVIPFAVGRALFERLREPKTFVTIRGGDHNDLRPTDESTYWYAVDRFVAGVQRAKQ